MINQDDFQTNLPEGDSRQTLANRLNAQLSTGPKGEDGKRRSALNAVKTGLTGHTVLLPTDDVPRYQEHVADWFADLKPETPREKSLTQSIADTHWRLDRIVKIEHSLYALGRIRFEAALANEMQDDVDSHQVSDLLDGYIHFFYEKQLRNLGIQEARLRRQRDKDLKELRQLQSERHALDAVTKHPAPSQPSATRNGFVFSTSNAGQKTRTTSAENPDKNRHEFVNRSREWNGKDRRTA